MSEVNKKIGANLKRMREGKGFTQTQLAELIGVSKWQYQKYEYGINKIPVNRIISLCAHLEAQPNDFLVGVIATLLKEK